MQGNGECDLYRILLIIQVPLSAFHFVAPARVLCLSCAVPNSLGGRFKVKASSMRWRLFVGTVVRPAYSFWPLLPG